MSQREKTKDQAKQNKPHAVAGIEAHPTPPHCCFIRDDRCNLSHADLQCVVAGREHRAPERVDEMEHSESKGNARTKNHQNFGGQDAYHTWAKIVHVLARTFLVFATNQELIARGPRNPPGFPFIGAS